MHHAWLAMQPGGSGKGIRDAYTDKTQAQVKKDRGIKKVQIAWREFTLMFDYKGVYLEIRGGDSGGRGHLEKLSPFEASVPRSPGSRRGLAGRQKGI